MISKKYVLFAIYFLFSGIVHGSNLWLGNGKLTDSTHLYIEISWQNSWNVTEAPFNHDAVWLFFKFRTPNGQWQHLPVSKISAEHTTQSNTLQISATNDGMGVFVKNATTQSTDIENTALYIKLENYLYGGEYEFRAFGIEMVYVPQGAFWVGDSASINALHVGGSKKPYLINSENEIMVGNQPQQLSNEIEGGATQHIPAHFPKGFNAFYCMKYEITQQQYADFLNTLTYQQQANRTAVAPNSNSGTWCMGYGNNMRNGVVISYAGTENTAPARYACNANNNDAFDSNTDAQSRAMNWLSWYDLAAYLDWAALRPLTETEFEKTCRGANNSYVGGEFAWGTPFATDANNVLYDGTDNESVSDQPSNNNGLANHGYTGVQGALRSGFAGVNAIGRLPLGASYYGACEMSGNVWEICVSLNNNGHIFDGSNGNGKLDTQGNADENTWTNADGAIYRGGAWLSGIGNIGEYRDLATSDRYYSLLPPQTRLSTSGGRGARTE